MNCEGGIINKIGIVRMQLAASHDTLNRLESVDFKFYD